MLTKVHDAWTWKDDESFDDKNQPDAPTHSKGNDLSYGDEYDTNYSNLTQLKDIPFIALYYQE